MAAAANDEDIIIFELLLLRFPRRGEAEVPTLEMYGRRVLRNGSNNVIIVISSIKVFYSPNLFHVMAASLFL